MSNEESFVAVPAQSAEPITAATEVNAQADSGEKPARKQHKRSRNGCYTCRLRRKKCDEVHPSCKSCSNLGVKCEYTKPNWWISAERRRVQKDRIKNKIKHTKLMEKHTSLREFMNRARESLSVRHPITVDYDPSAPLVSGTYGSFSSSLPTPGLTQEHDPRAIEMATSFESQPTSASISQESSAALIPQQYQPQYQQQHSQQYSRALPTPPSDSLLHEYFNQPRSTSVMNPALFDPNYRPLSSFIYPMIPVSDIDRPILNHFVDNVLRVAFPILEVQKQGPERVRSILHSLQTNQSYFHSCLSAAAIHLKSSLHLTPDKIDHDIMRHRYQAISQLSQSLRDDTESEQFLAATLAMIFFHCTVGTPDDDLPDIPWNEHFQAASNMVDRLELMTAPNNPITGSAFSVTLTSWIDILGATMLGKMPQFADDYRTKQLNGTPSGLKELMGCDDRIMYLISEIACLDSLKVDGRIEDVDLRRHGAALSAQLQHTEPADQALENPYSSTGTIQPDQLTKNMSALFRIAARLYLSSLMPGFDRHQLNNISLVSAAAEILYFIPTGPYGFDLSLVWPFLITGAFSVQSSSFRGVLYERVKALGDLAEFGGFSRMYDLLQEVWKLADDHLSPPPSGKSDPHLGSPKLRREFHFFPCIGTPIKKQPVHWREVMRRNDWRYLLI